MFCLLFCTRWTRELHLVFLSRFMYLVLPLFLLPPSLVTIPWDQHLADMVSLRGTGHRRMLSNQTDEAV